VPRIVLPTLTYGYFPDFSPFPGSLHLEAHTFERTVREIIVYMHRHGPRRYLVLNTGVSTFPVLEIVARDLDRVHRLLVDVTRIGDLGAEAARQVLQQSKGSHADEHETSFLMAVAPVFVRSDRLVAEAPDRPDAPGMFVPPAYHREPGPCASKTGVFRDATLASAEKGRVIAAAMVEDLVTAAERLLTAPAATPRRGIPRNTTLRQELALVRFGGLMPVELAEKACLSGARMMGLPNKGRLEPGADARWVFAHGEAIVDDGRVIGTGGASRRRGAAKRRSTRTASRR